LEDSEVKDYLIPLKSWLKKNSEWNLNPNL
jgi:hypothetical protein